MAKNSEIILKLLVDNRQAQVALGMTDKDVQKLAASLKGVGPSAGVLGQTMVNAFTNVKNVMMGIEQSFSAMNKVFGTGIQYALDYEFQMAKLEGIMASNGNAAGVTAKEMETLAGQISKTTIFTKSAALEAEQYLLTMENISGETLPKAIEAATGVATVMGTDLKSAAASLAMVLESPADSFRKLRSLMVILEESEKKQVKNLQEMYGVEAAQTYILDIMANKYGEVNEKIEETSKFDLTQITKSVASFGKEAGKAQLEGIAPLINGVASISKFLSEHKAWGAVVLTVGQLTAALVALRVLGVLPLVLNMPVLVASLKLAGWAFVAGATDGAIMTGAMLGLQAAIKGLWASIGPVGWAVLGLSALVTVVGFLSTKTQEAAAAGDEEVKSLKKQGDEFQRMVPALSNTNKELKTRVDKLNDVRERMGLYRMEGIKSEEDIQKAIATTTAQYQLAVEAKIRLKKYEASRTAQIDLEESVNAARIQFEVSDKKVKELEKSRPNSSLLAKEKRLLTSYREDWIRLSGELNAQQKKADGDYKQYEAAQNKLDESASKKRVDIYHHADPNKAKSEAKKFFEEMLKLREEALLGEQQAALNAIDREAVEKRKLIGKVGITEALIIQWVADEKNKINEKYREKQIAEDKKLEDAKNELVKKQLDAEQKMFEIFTERLEEYTTANTETNKQIKENQIAIIGDEYARREAEAKNAADNETAIEKAKYDKQLIDYETYVAAKKAIDDKYENNKAQIEKDKTEAHLRLTANNLNMVAGLFAENTLAYKAFATAGVIADSIQAAMAAYSSTAKIPIIGPFMAPIMAAAASAYGAKKIAEIQGVKFEKGGFALTGENGPEIIAPVTTYAQGQSALIEAVTSRMSVQNGGGNGGWRRLGDKMDRMISAIEAIDLRVDEMGLAVAVNKGNARLGRRQA